jgi:peptidoglycan/xylan/chitin deacetylase (PgdA/CDA1 family)
MAGDLEASVSAGVLDWIGNSVDFANAYLWNYRPQEPARPAWFKEWPNGARLAVSILVLHEWESVPWHRTRPMPPNAHYTFDFLALGAREYGARNGIWRLLDVLDRRSVLSTVITSGLVAEFFPDTVRAAKQRGHEVASHQWDQSVFPVMFRSPEEERDSLLRSKEALERASGGEVVGYMSPGPRPSPHTLDLSAELGFVWTADFRDSDVPYLIDVGTRQLVSVGYAVPGYVDSELLPLGLEGGLQQLRTAFDATYAEAERHPMKFCYSVHVHWGASPGMAWLLDNFLLHAKGKEGVWFARCIDIADYWLASRE